MDTLFTWLIAGSILGFFLIRYWREHQKNMAALQAHVERGPLFSEGPRAQHPRVAMDQCIGCGACEKVCPIVDKPAVYVTSAGETRSKTNVILLENTAYGRT